jgi:hypothetical protein
VPAAGVTQFLLALLAGRSVIENSVAREVAQVGVFSHRLPPLGALCAHAGGILAIVIEDMVLL